MLLFKWLEGQQYQLTDQNRILMKNSDMGNQNATISLSKDLHQNKTMANSLLKSTGPRRNSVTSTGSENIGDADEEIDECSPSTKFDIRFLATSFRASHFKQQPNEKQINENNCGNLLQQDKKLKQAQNKNSQKYSEIKSTQPNKKLKQVQLQNKSKNINPKRSSFSQKSQKEKNINLKRVSFSSKNKTPNRLQAIKNYTSQVVGSESPLTDIVILGENFYKIRQEPIQPFYLFLKKIGQGSFGSVYKGKCIKTGELRAIKILKKKSMNQNDQKSLLSEINILKKMDHINIIKLYDVFFFNNFFYVVTEYCDGGNLLTALQKQHIKSEKQVMLIMKQIISAVSYMHQKNTAHRDLKLENVVLVKQISKSYSQKICIKLIDFGLAEVTLNQQKNKTGIVGTVSYMPPEIFSGYFSTKSDVWSCGIIMCMLLIGYNPYKRKNQTQTVNTIQNQNISFYEREWLRVSGKAKNLIILMLEKDPEKRISAEKILNHEWTQACRMTEKKELGQIEDQTSDAVISNFNSYHRGNNFICYVKNFLISRQLTQSLRQQMAQIFEKIDSDSSGVIEKEELVQLFSLISGTTSAQIQKIIQKIDQNKSGRIDFQEFLVCMTDNEMMRNNNCINEAFDFFDEDHTGYIERKQLYDCLEGCEQDEIVNLIKASDFNGDGKISRDQFMKYLMTIQI